MKQYDIVSRLSTNLFWIFCLAAVLFSKEYSAEINTISEFDSFSSNPLSAKYGSIASIKILYDISNDSLYYLSSDFRYHFDFCKEVLKYKYKLKIFNKFNYLPSSERSFVCANINKIKNSDKYFIDFSVGERITVKRLSILLQKIKKTFLPDVNINILANTTTIRDTANILIDSSHIYTPDILFKEQPYQMIQSGEAIGILTIDTNLIVNNQPKITILTETINNPDPAEGYISASFITPLSHIAILTHSNKTPTIALPKLDTISKLIGKPIKMTINKNSYSILALDTTFETEKIEYKKHLKKLKISKTDNLLIPLSDLSFKDIKTVGAKAVNLAELSSISVNTGFKIPEDGAVIPFSAYMEHIKNAALLDKIGSLNKISDIDEIKNELKQIRSAIKNTSISPKLDSLVSEHIEKSNFERFRFRSSSNAEDIVTFSGAGLYNSVTGTLSNPNKPYNMAIKKVWASLWSERAFFQRKRAGIDQSSAAMAILMHRGFPDEELNGVAVTKNIYREDTPYGYTITMQKGDLSVVSVDLDHTPELSISYLDNFSEFYNRLNAVDYITYSSITNEPLLNMEDMKKLSRIFRVIKNHFYKSWNIRDDIDNFAVDIEFKIDRDIKNRRCYYIKQARPY